MPDMMHLNVHAGNSWWKFFVPLPTILPGCKNSFMGAVQNLAENLHRLMTDAGDRRDMKLATQKGLARQTGLSRPTIEGALKATRALRIDNLEAIAKAFDLQAWQLLTNGLDPANPPVVPASDAERALWASLDEVRKKLREAEPKDSASGNAGADSHRPRKAGRKAPAK